jgi:hypothetical protein
LETTSIKREDEDMDKQTSGRGHQTLKALHRISMMTLMIFFPYSAEQNPGLKDSGTLN